MKNANIYRTFKSNRTKKLSMKQTTCFAVTACCFIAYLFSTSFASAADLTVGGGLSCEYLDDPVGIDSVAPRLSWWLCSEKRGQVQTAYQILVASNVERLAADEGDLWDSGRVKSDQATHVEYDGKPLESHQRCYWKVRAWDKNGQPSKWSKPGVWTMGHGRSGRLASGVDRRESQRQIADGVGKWLSCSRNQEDRRRQMGSSGPGQFDADRLGSTYAMLTG